MKVGIKGMTMDYRLTNILQITKDKPTIVLYGSDYNIVDNIPCKDQGSITRKW